MSVYALQDMRLCYTTGEGGITSPSQLMRKVKLSRKEVSADSYVSN